MGIQNRIMKSLYRCNSCRHRGIGPTKEIVGNFDAVDRNVSIFAPNQCLYQKVAMGMQNPKM